MSALPIHAVLDDLRQVLARDRRAVLEAPPGAGKTTVVPLALLDAAWLAGAKIILLEPRRLAAKNAARYMAATLGEQPGETVGYRVRHESRVSARTRIEVVTEGVLTRMLQDDPALEGTGLVIFDEFHERSLNADLGLALALDARSNLREDLAVLVMSATLDGARVAALLDAAVIRTQGRQFPVQTRYAPVVSDSDVALETARAALELMSRETGSLLAFLPGAGEIRRAGEWLSERLPADIELAPLYGDLSPQEQDRAIRSAADGRRKLVLATNIAESSLTIEGVRLVVDSGLERTPLFDPPSAMTRLVTRRISQASADQRRGRAGRNEAGICLRLWREADTARLAPHAGAEILTADLAPLALELAGWGIAQPSALRWLDPPPAAAFAQARELLQELHALDDAQRIVQRMQFQRMLLELHALDDALRITPQGRAMLALPVHPRLAHMLLKARDAGLGELGCVLAALLEERDPLAARREADIDLRLRALSSGNGISPGQRNRILEAATQLAARLGVTLQPGRAGNFPHAERAAFLLAQAYPDRVARRRPGDDARYHMAGGRGAMLERGDGLARAAWLAVANVSGSGRDAKIFLAAELQAEDVTALEAEAGESIDVRFDAKARAVIARRVRKVGSLVLEERPIGVPAERALPVLLEGIRTQGLAVLPWDRDAQDMRARVETLRGLEPQAWPACDDASLLATLEEWLAPFLQGVTKLQGLASHTLREALAFRIGHERLSALAVQAPEFLALPSGLRLRIDYSGEVPVLSARIQQFFGLHATPAIANGRLPLMLELLSPANRPMQRTRDLSSFWANTYPEVRKDLRGRYPKHAWPEDPLAATPRARSVKQPGEK